MAQLTQRQTNVLKAIIEEFIETASPVGSETIEKKYALGVSPATIRNEMVQLTQLGYLKKAHSSSGRAPTSMGLKFYVKNLMMPKKLSVAEEVGVKEKIWDYRNQPEKMIKEAIKELSRRTQVMALAMTIDGELFTYGLSNLLDYHEFFDIDVTKTVLSLVDKIEFWAKIVERAVANKETEPFYLLVGEELEANFLEPCTFVYQPYQIGAGEGMVGVIGPTRLHYNEVVPIVHYVAGLISEFAKPV